MKKVIKGLIVFVLVVIVTGCGTNSEEGSSLKHLDLEVLKTGMLNLKIGDSTPFADENNMNNKETLEVYGLDSELLEEYLIYMPSSVMDASMYIIAKPISDQKSVVKYQIKDLFEKYYNAYNGYYPKEAKLIEDRMEKEIDGYLVYIVSNDNDKVYELIKESMK